MFISFIFFFANLYLRMVKSLDETVFRLSSKFKTICFVVLCVVIIADIAHIIWTLLDLNDPDHEDHGGQHSHSHIYGVLTYFNIIFMVLIVGAFIYKLRDIYSMYINTPDAAQNMDSKSLLELIIKQSMLSLISLGTFFVFSAYIQILGYFDEHILSEYMWMISYFGRDFVLLSFACFIYLSFKSNENR